MTPPEGTVVLDAARPDRPILVAGPRAFAVLGGAGEMALTLDTRGGPVEWGGVYGEGIRLTSRVEVRWREEERAADLASTMVRLEARLSDVASWHRDVGIEARQTIAPILELEPAPVIGRRIEFAARDGAAHAIHLELSVRPFLAPILLEGIKPYTYRVATRGECLTVDAHGWGLALAADPLPHHLRLDGRAWIGGRFTGEVDEIVLDYDLVVPAAGTLSVGWAIGGGYERWLGEVDGRWAEAIRGGGAAEAARARDDAWRVGTPAVELPRYPGIEAGYREARDGLRRLVHRGEPGLSGLVAGYPWYAAFWTRDLGWMLPALLWLGDHELAAEAIRTVFRFQAPGPIPVLGARRGELPMQIGDGPIFLYGTSDSTLYYPPALVALVDHSGDASVATALAAPLERLAGWIADRTDPATGLLRNGGEVAEIRSATGGVGRVHIGFDAVDTTIWDSTDRRDHAIDVQVLHVRALGSLARLAEMRGDADAFARFDRAARAGATTIPTRYAWPEERYLYDSLRRDGSAVRRIRPNALLAVDHGLVVGPDARAIVARAAEPDLTTPWGLRTLSDRDPGYDPQAYHDGQVWPIASAWAADAALAAGLVGEGIAGLERIGGRLAADPGLAYECYRGDRDAPYDACFLLGFSVGPFVDTIFRRLFGIRPFLRERLVRVEPALRPEDGPAAVRHLRLGDGFLDLEFAESTVAATWNGPAPIALASGARRVPLAPGTRVELPLTRSESS